MCMCAYVCLWVRACVPGACSCDAMRVVSHLLDFITATTGSVDVDIATSATYWTAYSSLDHCC